MSPVVNQFWIIRQIFTLGVICRKIWNSWSNRHLSHSEQATGHGMHCREILFTPRCSPRARQFPRSVNFSLRRTVAELRGVKVAQFPDFGLFSPYKNPKTYLLVTSQGLHRRMILIFACGSRRSKGVPSGTGDFLRRLVGKLGPPNLPKFFAYGKWLYHSYCYYTDLDQRYLKTLNSEDECTYQPNIFSPNHKITPKHILGTFQCETYTESPP